MVNITEDLVRKRSEHNEGQLSTLEELSLHQQDITKIEYLDKWCKELRILYLQSNLIARIENLSKLKRLVYLNLALNNIELVENLEGCESLEKLDLTINFIGKLSSIKCLQGLIFFRELFLTGNPCTDFPGYKEYVIAVLQQLKYLDGVEIEKSERIRALQNLSTIQHDMSHVEHQYFAKRELEKTTFANEKRERELEREALRKKKAERSSKGAGFDGRWYTDINVDQPASINDLTAEKARLDAERGVVVEDCTTDSEEDTAKVDKPQEESSEDEEFWEKATAFTPESRIETHRQVEKARRKGETKAKPVVKKSPVFFDRNGTARNVNDAKLDFQLTDDDENDQILLNLEVYKHLETCYMDVDVQPNYVRVRVRDKYFQLVLPQEISPDRSSCQRSQITGHLLITMPLLLDSDEVQRRAERRARQRVTKTPCYGLERKETNYGSEDNAVTKSNGMKENDTDLTDTAIGKVSSKFERLAEIVQENGGGGSKHTRSNGNVKEKDKLKPKTPSKDFVDNPEVPPLI